jgi:hypothetical protein
LRGRPKRKGVGSERPKKRQAKADAQSAREARAKAENKFANAESARATAEERLKAGESATKNQGGFGAWLRSWFGPNHLIPKISLAPRTALGSRAFSNI